jgi:hypothetical protein
MQQLRREELEALERFRESVRMRELERLISRSPSGRRTLIFPGEPMPRSAPAFPDAPPPVCKSPD